MQSLSIVALSFLMITTTQVPAVDIIAHRGASFDAPENTITALKLGYAQGADAAECDIHLTQDKKIVLIHDGDTQRITSVRHSVANTEWAILKNLNAANWGAWKNKGFSEKLPLLEEALKIVPKGKKLFIEIKGGPELLPELKRVILKARTSPDQTPLIAFDYEIVSQAKAIMPQLEVCWLASSDEKTKEYPAVEQLITKALAAGVDGLDLDFRFPIDKSFVAKVKAARLKLYIWTVDDPAVARIQLESGVDGITTNRPEWLRRQLSMK